MILVLWGKGDLQAYWVSSRVAESLARHTPLLVHLPYVYSLLRLRWQRHQELVILRTEGHGDERLVHWDFGRADYLTFLKDLTISFSILGSRSVVIDPVDGAQGCLFTFLSNSEGAAVMWDGHGSDAFSAFDARIGFLGAVFDMKEDNIMACRVHDLDVINEEDVVCDVRF